MQLATEHATIGPRHWSAMLDFSGLASFHNGLAVLKKRVRGLVSKSVSFRDSSSICVFFSSLVFPCFISLCTYAFLRILFVESFNSDELISCESKIILEKREINKRRLNISHTCYSLSHLFKWKVGMLFCCTDEYYIRGS